MLTGTLLPEKKTSKTLLCDQLFFVYNIQEQQKNDDNSSITKDEIEMIQKKGPIYEVLSRSNCPSIVGHNNVKKALLLQMVGGVKKKINSFEIRGNLHILLVGNANIII